MQLPSHLESYCDFVSCLHALEHFGLGRYGDLIDYFGYKKGFNNITAILQPRGIFYFSVPMGRQRIEFNAHRVFSLKYLIHFVSEKFVIEQFSYVNNKGDFCRHVTLDKENGENNFNCIFGCAIFELRKSL